MTLEEKIGQMCELNIDVLQDKSVKDRFQLSEALLDSVIGKYKVGSILNVPTGEAIGREAWQEIITAIQKKSMKEIGIPCVYGVDQMHGTTYTDGGTLFPQGNNMGATFNRELVREGSRISAYETKAASIPWVYAPVVDLGREPRWSRIWENFGKDRTPSNISPQEMREKHFAPFLEAVCNGALTVMVNSQSNNGMPLHANYEYLTQWLKEDLQWDGMMTT